MAKISGTPAKRSNSTMCICFAGALSLALASCVSDRQICEWNAPEDKDIAICVYLIATYSQCKEREAIGQTRPGHCEFVVQTCMDMMHKKEKCDKESDIPYNPKVVIKWLDVQAVEMSSCEIG